jgi:hypothetical protein
VREDHSQIVSHYLARVRDKPGSERYVAQAINAVKSNRSSNPDPASDMILDLCFPRDLKPVGQPLQFPSTSQRSKQPHILAELVPSNDASRRLLRSSTKARRVPLSPVSSMAHTFRRSTFRVPSSSGRRNLVLCRTCLWAWWRVCFAQYERGRGGVLSTGVDRYPPTTQEFSTGRQEGKGEEGRSLALGSGAMT